MEVGPLMDAYAFADWLSEHGHEEVFVHTTTRVTSMFNGKPRGYVLLPAVMSDSGSLFGDDLVRGPYWRRVVEGP